jgi:uncharacterized protein (DUF2141 family)
MTLTQKLTLFAMASITVAGSASADKPGRLTVRVHGMRNSEGQALCALFDKADGFPESEHALKGTRAKVTQGRASCTFAEVKPGVYAVATFHDEDGDGSMDTILGIPTEGFGFSNNAKPSTFGPPSFKKAAFRMGKGHRAVSIKMLYL